MILLAEDRQLRMFLAGLEMTTERPMSDIQNRVMTASTKGYDASQHLEINTAQSRKGVVLQGTEVSGRHTKNAT